MLFMNTTAMKEALETEKKHLEGSLAEHGRFDPETNNWVGSAPTEHAEGADRNVTADTMEELGTNSAIVEELETRYQNVLAALKKIEDGTYGTCEVGGEQISEERLAANPAARTCVEHAGA